MSDTVVPAVVATGASHGADCVLSAFERAITPVRAAPLYVLGLFIVAVAMVVLPLIYIAIICCVAYGVYYHATQNVGMLEGSGTWERFLVFVTPIVVGGILILFMIKPLFARQPTRENRHSLERANEPLLFAFVERLCQTIGAPIPRRIDVDCHVNASAGFRRGLLSLLGRDLVLTLGLPLVVGLNLRQLTGVLAHEFGHFTQGAAMRLTYVIRSVNFWFARVVYERDSWDERLVQWSEQGESRLRIVLLVARLFVWLTRRILWVLMMTGHAISCWMMRQMEYDADRHESRVAGSETFQSTMSRMQLLGLAAQRAYTGLRDLWREGTLVDNLPMLIATEVGQIPEELQAAVGKEIEHRKAGPLDTHPADQSRIANARKENAPGVFRLEEPATVLFRDLEGVCKAATRLVYADLIGPRAGEAKFISASDLIGRQGDLKQQEEAMLRFFGPVIKVTRPLTFGVDQIQGPSHGEKTLGTLRRAREQMERDLPQAVKLYEDCHKTEACALDALQAKVLLQVGLRIDAKMFQLSEPTLEAAEIACDKASEARGAIGSRLAPFENAARARLGSALALLATPGIAEKIQDADRLRESIGPVEKALAALNEARGTLRELHERLMLFQLLLENLVANKENKRLIDRMREGESSILDSLNTLRERLACVSYPFEHVQAGVSLGQYAVESVPPQEDISKIYEAAEEAIDKLHTLYFRSLAHLVSVAERVEASLGLGPIALPANEPEENQVDAASGRA
jgi:hypothetical protein